VSLPAGEPTGIPAALTRYRVMAYVVGTLLVVLVLVGVPLKYLTPHGSSTQLVGEGITEYLGVAHGFLYMVFIATALDLARRCRWSLGFTALTVLLGTVPILSFVAERHASSRVREQLVRTTTAGMSAR
jgi:integral membrane protein